jgi:hypothetical protein
MKISSFQLDKNNVVGNKKARLVYDIMKRVHKFLLGIIHHP